MAMVSFLRASLVERGLVVGVDMVYGSFSFLIIFGHYVSEEND